MLSKKWITKVLIRMCGICDIIMHPPTPIRSKGVGGHIDFGVDPVGVSESLYISVAVCLHSNLWTWLNLHRSQKEWQEFQHLDLIFKVLIVYDPVNTISVMLGRVFLGWTSIKQGLMYLAQGYKAEPATFQSVPLSHCTPHMNHSCKTLWKSLNCLHFIFCSKKLPDFNQTGTDKFGYLGQFQDFFCSIWFFTSQSAIFQLCWDMSSWGFLFAIIHDNCRLSALSSASVL